jgi:hypothetical protein
MMISTFLDESYANPQNSILIQNQLSRFMSDDSDDNFNESLEKLIVRVQKIKTILEPLLELVLRATKEFSKPSFKKSHLQAQFGITVKYCQFSKSRLKKVMRKWQLKF